MSYINELTVMGNLGQDPVAAYMANGDAALTISVATSEKWTDRNSGEVKESIEWHKVLLYKNQAEIVAKYMKKGDKIWVRGKVRSRPYTDREGVPRVAYELLAADMKIIHTKQRNQEPEDTGEENPLDQFS